ncbi:MAG: hypothetical protein AAFQ22_07220 [Pseudomonadota bacterium]
MDKALRAEFSGKHWTRAAPSARAILINSSLSIAMDTETGRHSRRATIDLETYT